MPIVVLRAPRGGKRLALLCALLFLLGGAGCSDRTIGAAPSEPLPLAVNDRGDQVELRGGGSTILLAVDPFRVSLSPRGGPLVEDAAAGRYFKIDDRRVALERVLEHHLDGRRYVADVATAAGVARFEVSVPLEGVVRLAVTPPSQAHATAAGISLASPRDEAVYGLIERTVSSPRDSEYKPIEVGSLDRRGTLVTMQVAQTVALYTPFFQTSRGYGVFVEGTSIGAYDLAASDPDALSFEFELPPGVDTLSTLVLGGGRPDAVVERYTAVTGRPFVPPEWAFKHWRWRDEHRIAAPAMLDGVATNADLVDDITHYEQLGIPVGNYTIDRPWGSGDLPDLAEPEEPGFGDLVWDETRFPNPQAMIDALGRRGYHVFLWVAPWATGVNTNREARERGYLAPGSCCIIDFTNPEASQWWIDKLTPLVKMGIAGFKVDRGDEDTPTHADQFFHDGRTGRELRNAYPELMAKVHHDAVRAVRGDDFLVYPRTGYAGSQRWAVFSAGDLPGRDLLGTATDLGLRAAILALQHDALNGFPIWGSDTGGYEQFGDREVFARWIEFSAFCPIMEIGGVGTHAPWDMPTEPNYDAEMIDIYRQYTTLHHALVPYIYGHAREAGRTGRPIGKPLVFDYPDDPRVRDLWQEFLLGDDVLVAPVWRVGQRTQHVYLPAGRWVDALDHARVVEGPADLDEPAPLGRIPVFVRAGADVLRRF